MPAFVLSTWVLQVIPTNHKDDINTWSDSKDDLLSKIPNDIKRSFGTLAWSRIKLALSLSLSLSFVHQITPNHSYSIKPHTRWWANRCLLTSSLWLLFVIDLTSQSGTCTLTCNTLNSNYIWSLAQRRTPRRIYIQVKACRTNSSKSIREVVWSSRWTT